MKRFLFLIVLLLPGAVMAQLAKKSSLPVFKFYKLNDNSEFTASHIEQGKKSIIIFFDTGCDHCQHEMKAIGERYAEFRDVNFYLVSMNDKPAVEGFMNTYGKDLKDKKNVTVLLDTDHKFLPTFLPDRFPGIYIYSADQKLSWHMDGQRDVGEILEAVNKG